MSVDRRTTTPDGLADRVAAVQAARSQLGRNLGQLDSEVRAQMSSTAERLTWRVVGTGLAIVAGLVVRKVFVVVWRAATSHDPPTNPAAPDTSWGEALGWALASGAAIGVGRMVATRGATAGWTAVVGAPPPDMSKPGR
jgi:hypothetical protein